MAGSIGSAFAEGSPLAWPDATDHSIELNGMQIHYREGGREDAPTMLFVHGLTASARTWDPVIPPFASDHHVLSVDLRGHGDSSWATWETDGYRTGVFASDLAALITTLGVGPVHYVGHSLGARIGIAFAGSEPSLVRSLALSDTLPEVPREGALQVRQDIGERSQIVGFRTVEDAIESVSSTQPGWQEHQYEHFVRSIMRPNWVGKIVPLVDPQLFWITTGSASKREAPYCWDLAERIECPTLIMWGKRSKLMSRELVDRMIQCVPAAEVAEFETDHYILREAPAEWIQSLRAFVDSVD